MLCKVQTVSAGDLLSRGTVPARRECTYCTYLPGGQQHHWDCSQHPASAHRCRRIVKLPAGYGGRSSEMIINSEWGDFNHACLPMLPEDVWVDCSSVNPGGVG